MVTDIGTLGTTHEAYGHICITTNASGTCSILFLFIVDAANDQVSDEQLSPAAAALLGERKEGTTTQFIITFYRYMFFFILRFKYITTKQDCSCSNW